MISQLSFLLAQRPSPMWDMVYFSGNPKIDIYNIVLTTLFSVLVVWLVVRILRSDPGEPPKR